MVHQLSRAALLAKRPPCARRIAPRLWVRRIQSDGGVERRDRFFRSIQAQEQLALPSVHEVAAVRGRANRGVAIRKRFLRPTQARVKIRAKEKGLCARSLDSVEGHEGVVGFSEDPQGARKVGDRADRRRPARRGEPQK